MRRVVKETQVGTRTILGAEFPVVDQIVRVQLQPHKRPTWEAVRRLCDGVPETAIEYSTLRDATAKYNSWHGGSDEHHTF